jgi:hypothetical protein
MVWFSCRGYRGRATVITERVEYLGEHGKLVTKCLRDFTKKALKKCFASRDNFLKRRKAAERKQAIVEELEAEGLPLDPIAEELGKNSIRSARVIHCACGTPFYTCDLPAARVSRSGRTYRRQRCSSWFMRCLRRPRSALNS